MKNIIRYEIHYGGSLRSGRLNIAKASMIRNQPCNENELITNEQSIVLSLSKLLEVIMMTNRDLLSGKSDYLFQDNFRNRKKKQFDTNHFDNLDKLIKGGNFNLYKNTQIDQSQDNENINRCFRDKPKDLEILRNSNCVGLKLINVIFNSYGNLNEKTYIDEHVLDKIYNLCLPFKDELLLFENYNSFNPNNEMFDIAKLFFNKKEEQARLTKQIVYDSQETTFSRDEFDLI